MLTIQERKSDRSQIYQEHLVDRAARDLEDANEILRDLKPPPREREISSALTIARDSQRGINEVAQLVEETLRSSAEGAGTSPAVLSDQITMAKNFVTAEGTRKERSLNDKSINGASPSDLKLAAAQANGTRIGDTIPEPQAIENAEKISNATPFAHAIAHGIANEIRIAEGITFPMLQSIKESHERLIGGHRHNESTTNSFSTENSIKATHHRLLAISESLEMLQQIA